MLLQMVYTIVCTLPAPILFYRSEKASAAFLICILTMSVWNGAGWYIEVFGRKFEKELDALRRELDAAKEVSTALDQSQNASGKQQSSTAGQSGASSAVGTGAMTPDENVNLLKTE